MGSETKADHLDRAKSARLGWQEGGEELQFTEFGNRSMACYAVDASALVRPRLVDSVYYGNYDLAFIYGNFLIFWNFSCYERILEIFCDLNVPSSCILELNII